MSSAAFGRLSLLCGALLAVACGGPTAPFWEIQHDGASSYLLGTMHLGVPTDELPASVWEYLAEARVFYAEADLRLTNPQEFAALVTLPAGERVQPAVSSDDWLLLVNELAGLFDANQLDTLQPWFVNGALIRSYLPEADEMDAALVQRAEEEGVAVGFFETWREQTLLLNNLGIEDGLIPLLEAARDPELTKARLEQWRQAYQSADLDLLADYALEPEDMTARPRYYEEIIFARNRLWLDALASELDQGGAFVAVGFAHCLEEQGLVDLLRANGATVERIP